MGQQSATLNIDVGTCFEEVDRRRDFEDRQLYLYGEISSICYEEKGAYQTVSMVSKLREDIFEINREDAGIPAGERKPIRLYINSPGGDVTEGFALVEAIELSKTPVWTINVGEWCSMAFLIGIAGHRRLSMRHMTFLMHEGTSFAGGSASKMQDRAKYDERFKNEVIKPHVLRHSNMSGEMYDELERVELYMLPEDALEHGFIDEIVTDIDTIL